MTAFGREFSIPDTRSGITWRGLGSAHMSRRRHQARLRLSLSALEGWNFGTLAAGILIS